MKLINKLKDQLSNLTLIFSSATCSGYTGPAHSTCRLFYGTGPPIFWGPIVIFLGPKLKYIR
jgi:hypothetical protein